MSRLSKKFFLFIKTQPIYTLIFSIGLALTLYTQNQYWFGEHTNKKLSELKNDITAVELQRDRLIDSNTILIEEKKKLSSGRQALEGIARIELGMIKPNETFYVFKKEQEKEVFEDK